MLHDLRVKIRTRRSRIQSCRFEEFQPLTIQFFAFLRSNAILSALISELLARNPESVEEAKNADAQRNVFGETDERAAAIAYVKWHAYSEQDNPHAIYSTAFHSSRMEEILDKYRDWYVEPLFEYLDEVLDDGNIVLATLTRYKHKAEWYRREELQRIFSNDTSRAEHNLAKHMYEYLFDQGIPFHVEPQSASGRPDVVSLENADHRFVGDVKIFDAASRGATYIKKGLYQVYRYCWDYNEPVGHVIVFNVSDKQLRLELPSESDGIPRFEYNHKTIFVTVIDVHQHEGSASTRGIPDTIMITAGELVREVREEESAASAPVTESPAN
jgi:hypothetical protein